MAAVGEEQREAKRKAVGLLVKLTHAGIEEFVDQYATNLSEGGMFLRTKSPMPIGTELNFRVEIAGGLRVLQGLGRVKWVRARSEGHDSPARGRKQPRGRGCNGRAVEPGAQMCANLPRAAQAAAHCLIEMMPQRLNIFLSASERDRAPLRLPKPAG